MKISLIADPHLNKTIYKGVMDEEFTDLPFRNADLMRAFEFAIDKNVNEIKPDLLVVLGDVYDHPHPFNPVRTFFNAQLHRLSEANIPTIILVGNHDICSKHHALEPIAALGLKNVSVISSPVKTIFKDKILMLFPYSIAVEKKEIPIREQFHQFVKESKEKIQNVPNLKDKEILFFGHFGVNGAVKNSYDDDDNDVIAEIDKPKKKVVVNHDSGDISIDDLDSIGAKYIFLGDYHEHQSLSTKDAISFYVGSPEKCNFAEKDHKKGFVVYDSEAQPEGLLGSCTFIEYPNCRPMVELKGNYESIMKSFEAHPASTKTLVKLFFVGDEKELLEYSIKSDELRKKLRSKFKPIHIFPKQKIINEEDEKEASQIENDIMEKGHIDDDDVKQVVEEIIKEREKDLEEQVILISIATEIYEETKAE